MSGVIVGIGSLCRVAGLVVVVAASGGAQAQQRQKGPPPSPVPAPYSEVRSSCASEIKGTCAGVVPGSAESVLCLRRNFAVHSPPCQAALQRAGIPQLRPSAQPDPGKPAPPRGTADAPRQVSTDRIAIPAPPAPAEELKVPSMRPTQEARFVARNCREDHSLLCQGVPYGQVLKCLAGQQQRLTNKCHSAIARRR
ncbi:MAG: hypothetical protein AB7F98_19385 [Novosphingobium sp.]